VGEFRAAAAIGGHTQAALEVFQAAASLASRFPYLAIGNLVADADVHGFLTLIRTIRVYNKPDLDRSPARFVSFFQPADRYRKPVPS
jgi:hypothetical protein